MPKTSLTIGSPARACAFTPDPRATRHVPPGFRAQRPRSRRPATAPCRARNEYGLPATKLAVSRAAHSRSASPAFASRRDLGKDNPVLIVKRAIFQEKWAGASVLVRLAPRSQPAHPVFRIRPACHRTPAHPAPRTRPARHRTPAQMPLRELQVPARSPVRRQIRPLSGQALRARSIEWLFHLGWCRLGQLEWLFLSAPASSSQLSEWLFLFGARWLSQFDRLILVERSRCRFDSKSHPPMPAISTEAA